MDQVLDLLRRSDRSFRRARGAHRRLLIALLLVVGPFYIGSLIFAGIGLVHAWQGGDWLEMFWHPFAIAAPFATSLTKFAVIPDDRQVLYQPIADLRVAIRSGDEALAPKSEPAVSAAPFVFGPTGRVRVGPLRRPQSTAGTVYMICGGLALMALIISVPAAMAAGSLLAALIVSASLAPLAGLLLLLGARTLGSFSVYQMKPAEDPAPSGLGMQAGSPAGATTVPLVAEL
jgi:MFS family permease